MIYALWVLLSIFSFFAIWWLIGHKIWVRKPFINKTSLPDQQLWEWWKAAQQEIATGQGAWRPNDGPNVYKQFPGALRVGPRAIAVTEVPDTPWADLNAYGVEIAKRLGRTTNPSGVIPVGMGNSEGFCYSYTSVQPIRLWPFRYWLTMIVPSVCVAKSNQQLGTTGYEFQNCILALMGKNLTGR